jgi:hypothetical protein
LYWASAFFAKIMRNESKSRNITWEQTNPGLRRLLAQATVACVLLEATFHLLPVPGDPILNGVRATRAAVASILSPQPRVLFPQPERVGRVDLEEDFLPVEAKSALGGRVVFVKSLGRYPDAGTILAGDKNLTPRWISFVRESGDSPSH